MYAKNDNKFKEIYLYIFIGELYDKEKKMKKNNSNNVKKNYEPI